MPKYISEFDGLSDAQLMNYFVDKKPWGMELLINLYGCDVPLLSDKEYIRQFIIDLCDFIKMKRYGEPVIERFGEGHLFGISAMQLIMTSSIIMHCAENTGDIYIDIFSCREFPPKATVEFCIEYFKATTVKYGTVFRE